MCLAIPMKVVELQGRLAVLEAAGNRQTVDMSLVEGVAEGDYVIVHAGYAISRLDEEEALVTLDLFRQAFPELESPG